MIPDRAPAPPLSDAEAARLAEFDRRPDAPEAFRHLTTCQGTDDAPGLCECPATVPDLHGVVPQPPRPRPLVPDFLTGADR